MSTNTGSWLAAHGKLWYDDPWYRVAWIIWPQAVGLLVFVWLWLPQPGGQSFNPWAKPVAEPPRVAPPMVVNKDVSPPALNKTVVPPLAEQPVNPMASCNSGGFPERIQGCTSLLASGKLKGGEIPDAHWHRGWAYYSTKQYQLAMNDYNQAIAISPGGSMFYNDRAVLWMELGNNDRAMQDLDQAILIKPDYALAFMNRGIVLKNLKRPNEELVALSKAIELDPRMWLAFEYRAFLYEDRSDWRAMFDDASKMIDIQPNNRMGYEFRGHAYLESGQYQPAIADFTKAISIDPGAIYGYRMRGRAYYFLNQFDNAMADFEAALRIDPKDSSTISFSNDLKRQQPSR
jgi:tetratricopeptide (TPR) repeat protein